MVYGNLENSSFPRNFKESSSRFIQESCRSEASRLLVRIAKTIAIPHS